MAGAGPGGAGRHGGSRSRPGRDAPEEREIEVSGSGSGPGALSRGLGRLARRRSSREGLPPAQSSENLCMRYAV